MNSSNKFKTVTHCSQVLFPCITPLIDSQIFSIRLSSFHHKKYYQFFQCLRYFFPSIFSLLMQSLTFSFKKWSLLLMWGPSLQTIYIVFSNYLILKCLLLLLCTAFSRLTKELHSFHEICSTEIVFQALHFSAPLNKKI